jgi:hypothetical protein
MKWMNIGKRDARRTASAALVRSLLPPSVMKVTYLGSAAPRIRRLTICSVGGAYLVVPQVSLWLMARSIWTGRASKQEYGFIAPNCAQMEPMTGIEPAYSAWEADVLPLNYIGIVAWEG